MTLAIPYAKHPTRGRLSPHDRLDGVGLRANVFCLGCGEPLVHRRKSRDGKRAHFAHQPNSEADVVSCQETAVHARLKDMLASIRVPLSLPDWDGTRISFTPTTGSTETPIVTYHRTRRVADVLLGNLIGQQLAIEVWYAHRKECDAIWDYRIAKLPMLELPVTGDDLYIELPTLLKTFPQRAKWRVEPFEPFAADCPPHSKLSDEHLGRSFIESRRLESTQTMKARGFSLGDDGVWQRRLGSLVARISELGPNRTSVTVEIRNAGQWTLRTNGSWDLPSDALEPIMRLFLQVREGVERYQPNQYLGHWTYHLTEDGKGNWISEQAVKGVRITLFKYRHAWSWCISSKGWSIYNEGVFSSERHARGPAERWGSAMQHVTYS